MTAVIVAAVAVAGVAVYRWAARVWPERESQHWCDCGRWDEP